MKRIDLIKSLRALGWVLKGHGGSHDIYSRGSASVSVPRHAELKENTARAILRTARSHQEANQ